MARQKEPNSVQEPSLLGDNSLKEDMIPAGQKTERVVTE